MAETSGQYELAVAKAQMRSVEARQSSADSLGRQTAANRAELYSRMLGAALGIALLAVFLLAGSQFAWLINIVAGFLAVALTISIVVRRRHVAAARNAQYEAMMREKVSTNPSVAIGARREATDM